MKSFIPYGRQDVNDEDIEAVVQTLKSDWLTQGPTIEKFERAVAEYCGVKYAVAVSSATGALHIAYLAAGLKDGDALWTSPNTFVATSNAALYCGAEADFVDIDLKSYNMSVAELRKKLVLAKKNNRLPKIVAPVHMTGQSCPMEEIAELAAEYGFMEVEDASHALGASYRNRKVGSCLYSDMCIFSFHPVKIATSGEGGMALTNKKELYDRLIRLRTHGVTRDEGMMVNPSEGPWYFEQLDLGYNYRITDIQASLGYNQVRRLDEFVAKRQALARRYTERLAHLPVILPWQDPQTSSSWHLYVIRFENEDPSFHRRVFEKMRSDGIGVNLHYIPVYFHPYYQKLGFKKGLCPNSEKYYATAMTLPIYYRLTEAEQDRVIQTLESNLS